MNWTWHQNGKSHLCRFHIQPFIYSHSKHYFNNLLTSQTLHKPILLNFEKYINLCPRLFPNTLLYVRKPTILFILPSCHIHTSFSLLVSDSNTISRNIKQPIMGCVQTPTTPTFNLWSSTSSMALQNPPSTVFLPSLNGVYATTLSTTNSTLVISVIESCNSS